jgi:Protein of unknown function (DUF3467)
MPETAKVTKKTKDGSESRTLRVNRSTDESCRTIYCNNTQVAVSYFDFKIQFGEATSVTEDSLNVLDKVAIYMSPEHAGALYKLLGRQLESYTERFGSLRSEPGEGLPAA